MRVSNIKGPGPGRPKGSRNKITKDIREAVLNAFEKVGGVKYLVKQAEDNPQAFMALLSKILPTQVTGDPDNPLSHKITVEFVADKPASNS